jgi:hypothetical protein
MTNGCGGRIGVFRPALTFFVRLCGLRLAGAPVRPLSPQHGRLHPGQGVQPAQPAHHPSAGQTDERPAAVRAVAAQGQADGATDPQPAGAEGVRLQGRGQFPRVSPII